MEETVELGGNISLTGFNNLEPGMIVVVKKIVGTYAKKFSESIPGFENLKLTLKTVHERETNQKFELRAKVTAKGGPYNADMTDFNIFVILDKVLKKIEEQVTAS